MSKYIYKIENKANGKTYIGQSSRPEERWKEHKRRARAGDTKFLYSALRKYGEEEFLFTVIGEYEDYNKKERDFILFYSSLVPLGYNITKGGEEPPIHSGEDSIHCKVLDEEIERIQKELIQSKLTIKEIFKKSSYDSRGSINRINQGIMRYDSELIYPLRETRYSKRKKIADKIKFKLESTQLTQKEISNILKVSRTTVTAINNGQNWKDKNRKYPIR